MNVCFRCVVYLWTALFVFSSCSKETDDFVEEPAKRTLLLYIAGDNNLSDDGKRNINHLLEGARDGNLNGGNLLIYFDSKRDVPVLLKAKEQKNGEYRADTVRIYSEQNSMDVDVMKDVIHTVVDDFPAESYGLVLWSHGTAWLPDSFSSMLRSFGDDNGKEMEIEELAQAIPDHTFSFILFDACYMGSMEVLYELREKADYILASPTEILSTGFPYQEIVRMLFADTPDLEQVCSSFYTYYNQLQGIYRSATVSLSSTAEVEQLAGIVREIVYGKESDIYRLSLDEMQKMDYVSYKYHLLYDFDDFIRRLATEEQYEQFARCLEEVVLFKQATPKATYGLSGYPQIAMEHYSGLSVYVPQSAFVTLNQWYRSHTAWGKAVYGD